MGKGATSHGRTTLEGKQKFRRHQLKEYIDPSMARSIESSPERELLLMQTHMREPGSAALIANSENSIDDGLFGRQSSEGYTFQGVSSKKIETI